MKPSAVKKLRKQGNETINRLFFQLFKEIADLHARNLGYAFFDMEMLEQRGDGSLTLEAVETVPLDDSVLSRNLQNFADILYCTVKGSEDSCDMYIYGVDDIDDPVQRDILLTLTGHNASVEPCVERLSQPYRGAQAFFKDYLGAEQYQQQQWEAGAGERAEKARLEAEADERAEKINNMSGAMRVSGLSAGGCLIIFFGLKACRAYERAERHKEEARTEYRMELERESARIRMQELRENIDLGEAIRNAHERVFDSPEVDNPADSLE